MSAAPIRTVLVTGAASGIGRATAERFRGDGHRVIGVDRRGADIEVDLASETGRAELVRAAVEASGGALHAVVACAGTIGRGEIDVRVNHFGAVATLDGLRPLLAAADRPRAVAVASFAMVEDVDDDLVAHCLAGGEDAAAARAAELATSDPGRIYASSKRALGRWLRAAAPTERWAGAGIALNAVAPGIVRTAMTQPILDAPELRDHLVDRIPMPLGGIASADSVADAIAFLADERLDAVTGQVLFIDGGADCVRRPHDVWS
jgi:NAD(P)-dependent dehydrogenase (short-subunit alcohol dehydrogenase family)